ncbi:hypothetical protein B4N89_46895 [Embleya scabrispora]|uniref:Tetratricopeptide repeat protein n=1 Tax=Embleya scabrispora TaxID=159449 RepID=A0A1T3NIC6_9ACTN|nr:tetratricopeptide repeat protein [Embleya scabrispora]OPC76542.1 hypothetical protein B4N89_46895 [Embleya scabrispora]
MAHARDSAAALLAIAFPTDAKHPANLPTCRTLLPHVDALTRRHAPDHDTAHTARALDRAASYRQWQGGLAPAVLGFQRAVTARERASGPDHPDTLDSRNNLAGTYESAGDLGRAIPLYERTLADAERVLSPGHPLIAAVRVGLERARST